MTITAAQILIAMAIVLAALVLIWSRLRRTNRLQTRFSPEYDRVASSADDLRQAENALAAREKRVAGLSIKPLRPETRDQFIAGWRAVQAKFVDDPHYAVVRADELLGEVMAARGYPVEDFQQQADDLSVDHPEVVQNYRAGHDIALRHGRGEATTEDLRMAMIHYRALFDDLVNEPEACTIHHTVIHGREQTR